MEDNIHNGYLIPKGTLIITNVWFVAPSLNEHPSKLIERHILWFHRKMLHDPKIYSDPMKFNPRRFMGPNPEPDPRQACYGFGRR